MGSVCGAAVIIRVCNGDEREIVVRHVAGAWVARDNTSAPKIVGIGSTVSDAISDLLQILEHGDE